MKIEKLFIYPIKSLPKLELKQVELLETGPLKFDRSLALFDSKDEVYNAKRKSKFSNFKLRLIEELKDDLVLRASYLNEPNLQFSLKSLLSKDSKPRIEVSNWFSSCLNTKLELKADAKLGYPDDPEANGPTIVSEASISRVGEWFDLGYEEILDRFRANIIYSEVDPKPFSEDLLIQKEIQINQAKLLVTNICKRCVVPTRNPYEPKMNSKFLKKFMELREKEKPSSEMNWAYDDYYKFCMNSKTLKGGNLMLGDVIKLIKL